MVRLPVSGLEVAPRLPDGSDELMLREAGGSTVENAIALIGALAGPGDWAGLSVTDFEILLLAVRARTLGETLDLGIVCPSCEARVQVSFSVADYVGAVAPRRPPDVMPVPRRPGWYRLGETQFRLPTAGDQAAVAGRADAAKALAERCLDPPRPGARMRARVERAMAAMAPEVSRPIAGRCPECDAEVEAPIHVARLVVGELARDAASLHDDVDLIARAYHWPEADILKLPRPRRQAYAERIRQAGQWAA